MTYEIIKVRYLKNYIRDAQLVRFRDMGIITAEQYDELYALKHHAEPENAADGENV